MKEFIKSTGIEFVARIPLLLILLYLANFIGQNPEKHLVLSAGECYSRIDGELLEDSVMMIIQVKETKYWLALWDQKMRAYITKNNFGIYKDWVYAGQHKKVVCPGGPVYNIDGE